MKPIGRSEVEVRQLRVFLAVVEQGTVSAAAAALGLAQSTVSESLASLDRAVGAPTLLRRRGAQHSALTAVGETLLPHARQVLQGIEAAHVAIAGVTRTANASVRIVANESVVSYLIMPAMAPIRKRWPKTRFVLDVVNCAEGRARVVESRCDLAVLLDEHASAELEAVGVLRPGAPVDSLLIRRDVRLAVIARPDHAMAHQRAGLQVARHALNPFPVFLADADGEFHDLMRRYFAADRLEGPHLNPSGSIEGVKRGVADDPAAIGVIPHFAVADDLRNGRFVALALQPALPSLRLVAYLPRATTPAHPAVSEFLDQLRPATTPLAGVASVDPRGARAPRSLRRPLRT